MPRTPSKRVAHAREESDGKTETFGAEIINLPSEGGEIAVDELPTPRRFREDSAAQARFSRGRHGSPQQNSSGYPMALLALVFESESDAERPRQKARWRGSSAMGALRRRRTCPTAPIGAITNSWSRSAGRSDQVDLYEINEAFAVVTLAAIARPASSP